MGERPKRENTESQKLAEEKQKKKEQLIEEKKKVSEFSEKSYSLGSLDKKKEGKEGKF